MKTIAYTCSYETNDNTSAAEITKQQADIHNFCKIHDIKIDKIFTEISAKDDYKPVLLNIMSKYYNVADKIIITNYDTISRNKDFTDWVKDEFNRMNIEIICINIDNEKKEEEQKNKNLSNISENIKNIPSLPEIITKSIELMQKENTSAETLANLISNDIGLTARVLKLVNSAYYGFPKQISTIKQAITILGFTTIKGIIISASVFKMFSENSVSPSFNYKQFWKHSILTASASRMIANQYAADKSEDIFAASFLHDIGKIILARYDRENYANVLKTKYGNDIEYMKNEEKYCGLNHCEIGNIIAYSWNLPEIFCDIITYHHTPQKSLQHSISNSIVYISNKIVESLESNKNLSIDNITLDLLEKINISEQNIIGIRDELDKISLKFDDINSFLS